MSKLYTASEDTAVGLSAVSDAAVSDAAVSDAAVSDAAVSDAAVSDAAVSDASDSNERVPIVTGRAGLEVDHTQEAGRGACDLPTPSVIATQVQTLKGAVLEAVARRERLPQTLFWSLFRAELDDIKKSKARERLLRAIMLGNTD